MLSILPFIFILGIVMGLSIIMSTLGRIFKDIAYNERNDVLARSNYISMGSSLKNIVLIFVIYSPTVDSCVCIY